MCELEVANFVLKQIFGDSNIFKAHGVWFWHTATPLNIYF